MENHCASISIGGSLSRKTVESLINAILHDNAGPDWDVRFDSNDDIANYLRETAAASIPLRLFDSGASWGRFDAIESTCIDHNLSFMRHGEHEAFCEIRHFDGKAGKDVTCEANAEGEPIVSINRLQELVPQGLGAIQEEIDRLAVPEIPSITLVP